jgi:hypothetical protein
MSSTSHEPVAVRRIAVLIAAFGMAYVINRLLALRAGLIKEAPRG